MLRLYSIAEWIAFLCSILLLAKSVKWEYKIFFFYTLTVVIIEYYGRWMANELKIPNHLLFTFALFVFTCFYMLTTRSFLGNKIHKRIVSWLFTVFVIAYVLNLLFLQQFSEFNSYSFILGYTFLVVSCTFFYMEFLNKEVITVIANEPRFFIISGYFIYGTVTALIYTIHRYFAYLNIPADNYRTIWNKTNDIANVSLYLLLAVAFILIWKKRKL